MEQRHMQEKSRGAARPDVDARARAIQEQIIHIPRPAQPGNARPAAQSTAGHPSGAQQRPPQAALKTCNIAENRLLNPRYSDPIV